MDSAAWIGQDMPRYSCHDLPVKSGLCLTDFYKLNLRLFELK